MPPHVKPKPTPPKDTLLARFEVLWKRLKDKGWDALLQEHGLDLGADDLRAELLRPLPDINRQLRGFEDFAHEGQRAIEPGSPARSLLYHAFTSPHVTHGADGKALKAFPTPAELELLENLVFGLVPPSVQELRIRAGHAPMAVVVFASEYRPAIGTVHQKHADLCLSRTGVARVGNAEAEYLPNVRGYMPHDADDATAIRVLPCRYTAYVAVQMKGVAERFGPMRFVTTPKSDAERDFWVPIHKLFNGAECLRGLTLNVSFRTYHQNEKLRRAHLVLASLGYDTGWHAPDLNEAPFFFTDNIAAFSTDADDGTGLLVPAVHEAIVEEAHFRGQRLTYKTPRNKEPFRSSVIIDSLDTGARSAPEYIHARHRQESNGTITDLNTLSNMLQLIEAGGYDAVHYLDYTGDGFIDVTVPELALELPRTVPAYSMVGAVDFFPLVKQHELMQWWRQSSPPELKDNIWPSNPGAPEALSDTRYPANHTLRLDTLTVGPNTPRPAFALTDDTITAVVGLLDSTSGRLTHVDNVDVARASWLADGASGVFAPGWDTSIDRTPEAAASGDTIAPGVTYFNNYGLGSPFPEDAMLCAALSSYWPAAAPDITRTFAPRNYATATPLTDDQFGWDGIAGPVQPNPAVNEIEYRQIEYGDYVAAALANGFNIGTVARTTTTEYITRTLVMARAYSALGAVTREQKRAWAIFSFKPSSANDATLTAAEQQTSVSLNRPFTYRFQMFRHRPSANRPADHRNVLVAFDRMVTLYADPRNVLVENADGTWSVFRY